MDDYPNSSSPKLGKHATWADYGVGFALVGLAVGFVNWLAGLAA